jgi:hypothetical protein
MSLKEWTTRCVANFECQDSARSQLTLWYHPSRAGIKISKWKVNCVLSPSEASSLHTTPVQGSCVPNGEFVTLNIKGKSRWFQITTRNSHLYHIFCVFLQQLFSILSALLKMDFNLPRAKRSMCFNFENHYSTQRLRLRSTAAYSATVATATEESRKMRTLCKQCSSGKLAETRYKCSDGHHHCSNACMESHGCVKSNETKAKQVS